MMGKIDKYEWVDMGSSYVPSELSCSVLWAQLEQAYAITSKRQAHFRAYSQGLRDLAEKGLLRMAHVPALCQTNGHIFYILLPSVELRQAFEAGLKQRGISAFTHYVPLHSSPAGRKFCRVVASAPTAATVTGREGVANDQIDDQRQHDGHDWGDEDEVGGGGGGGGGGDRNIREEDVGQLQVTDRIYRVLLRLPMWADLTAVQVQTVIDALHDIAGQFCPGCQDKVL